MTGTAGTTRHWDEAYRDGDTSYSWYQAAAEPSLRMLEIAGASTHDSVIDVGGGASSLVDALLSRGWRDVTVLDVSAEGLHTARRRLGAAADRTEWLVADVLHWDPPRTWAVWHDRALLHFFTDEAERASYVRCLDRATAVGSVAVLATFATDGPPQCSGLPVMRYDAHRIAGLLGSRWAPVTSVREEHVTPSGVIQPFTWAAFRRQH